jgi:hypothetical protein
VDAGILLIDYRVVSLFVHPAVHGLGALPIIVEQRFMSLMKQDTMSQYCVKRLRKWKVMITNLFIFYITLVVISFCLKIVLYNPKLLAEYESKLNSVGNKSKSDIGSWVVEIRKPKKEIVVSECNTEGEVVKKILSMGYRLENIKDFHQL